MKRILGLALLGTVMLRPGIAAADTLSVGLIMPFSGEFAQWGAETKGGVEVYQKLHGDTVNGTKIQVLYRDEGGLNPARSKQLATEMILRDHISFLTGFVFSPDALAVADLITQAKMPTIITNAATGFITQKSPYFTRDSYTVQQTSAPMGTWAAANGIKTVDAVIADFVAGDDSLQGFQKAYVAGGGKILQVIKFPVTVADITPFYERVLQDKPQAAYIFGTGGGATQITIGTWAKRLKPAGIAYLGALQLEQTQIPSVGEGALGVIQSTHYPEHADNKINQALWATWKQLYGDSPSNLPDMSSVSAFDAMEMIYRAVAKFGAGVTGDQAIDYYKGMTVESPRGSFTIDPKTRDIIQNVVIEKVENVNGQLTNVPIAVIKDVKDPWKEEHPQ